MYIVNMARGNTHENASFVYLNNLDKISIWWDKDNDLEEEATDLFNVVQGCSAGTSNVSFELLIINSGTNN